MKIALLADSHFGARNDNLYILDYFQKFFDNIFFPTLDKRGIRHILHAGDVFDRRKFINFVTLDRAKRMFFDPLAKRNIDCQIPVGNHDIAYRNSSEINSPSLLLGDYPNVFTHINPCYRRYDNLDILLLPWITPENQAASMSAIAENKAKIILGHLEINGFEMARGTVCDHGLNRQLFDSYLTVFSGHFHYRSMHQGIYYLGTPYEMTWADYGIPKGFHILDTDTLEIEFIENPMALFQRIVYDDTLPYDPELDEEILTGSYVKLVIKKKTDPLRFDKYMDELNSIKTNSVMVVEETMRLQTQADAIELDGIVDTITYMKNYVTDMNTSEEEKESLLSLLTDLYSQANELSLD